MTEIDWLPLTAALRGQLSLPGTADWDHHRAAWNLAVPQHPAAVVHAADADDLAAAVRFAAAHGLAVSAQPGGHGVTGAANGTVLLRTAALDEIWIDADAGVARVGAGVKWGELQQALVGTGLTGPAGSNADVSVVGLCLAGGIGWFSRSHGTSGSGIRAAEVIGADGWRRWVDDRTDPDLMWALRGGGGDLVVVAALELDLVRAPELSGGRIEFAGSGARSVLQAFARACAAAPDTLTLFATMTNFPDLPMLPPPLRGRSFCAVDAVFLGQADRLRQLLAPITAAAPVIRDTVGPRTPTEILAISQEPTDPMGYAGDSITVAQWNEEIAQRVVGGAATVFSTQVRQLGGVLTLPPGRPAISGPIGAGFVVLTLVPAPVPEAFGGAQQAASAALQPLVPFAAGPSTLSMLPHEATLADQFGPADLRRLGEIKEQLDPRGVIRGNHPVLQRVG